MQTFVIGVNHRTAPVALRGCVAFAPQQGLDALARLRSRCPEQGFVLVSTCNRTELYGTLSTLGCSPLDCFQILLEPRAVDFDALQPSLYEKVGSEAIQHLFRVTAALDSMLVGEDQILGQVKNAFEHAKKAHATNMFLEVLFRHAVTAAKRVKSETAISRNSLSIGSLAVKAAEQVLGDLSSQQALVVGSGEMGMLAVRNLQQAGVRKVYVTKRSRHAKGEGMAESLPGVLTVDFDKRLDLLQTCSIVVSATQCPSYTLHCDLVRSRIQGEEPRVFLDLAVPRDIDPLVGELPGCSYFDMDQLQSVARENSELRRAELTQAEEILKEEFTDLERWWAHRQAMPTLRRLRVNMRRRWKQAEQTMHKHLDAEGQRATMGPEDWSEAYSKLASENLDVIFYRLREHATPEELDVLYRILTRAFRKW